jgi:hypothetical protein
VHGKRFSLPSTQWRREAAWEMTGRYVFGVFAHFCAGLGYKPTARVCARTCTCRPVHRACMNQAVGVCLLKQKWQRCPGSRGVQMLSTTHSTLGLISTNSHRGVPKPPTWYNTTRYKPDPSHADTQFKRTMWTPCYGTGVHNIDCSLSEPHIGGTGTSCSCNGTRDTALWSANCCIAATTATRQQLLCKDTYTPKQSRHT